MPYRVVWVVVTTAGSGQVAGSGRANSRPCCGTQAIGAGLAGRHREVQHPVTAQPPQDLHRQVSELVSQPHRVIPGVEDDQDRRVPLPPVPGGDQPGDHLTDLGGSDLGLIIAGAQPDASSTAVQEVRPGSSAATTEYGQPGIICACPLPRP